MAFDAIMWAKLKQCASLKDGKIPSEQLPSYIDEVIEVASYASLPQPGEKSKIYYTLDTQKSYRWGSSKYILVTSDNLDELVTVDDIENFVTEAEVDAKISSIEIPEPDLSNYFNRAETQDQIKTAIDNIKFPEVDTTNFATKQDVEDAVNGIKIPETDLTGYATEDFVRSEVAKAELNGKDVDLTDYYTKDETTAAIESAIGAVVIPDVSKFITMKDVEDKQYLSEIPSEYITSNELEQKGYLTEHQDLSDYAKKSEIPSIDGLATEDFVRNAIDNIKLPSVDDPNLVTQEQLDSALSTKADDILFTENYVVGLAEDMGSFKAGDSVKNLTLKTILTKLLNLSIIEGPSDDPTEEPVTVDTIEPLYYISNDSLEMATISRDASRIITDNTVTEKDAEGIFKDADGNVGYQLQYTKISNDPIPKLYLDPKYTLKSVQVFDDSTNKWIDSDYMLDPVWTWDESPTLETININGKDVELKVYTYNFDETDEIGSTEYRFVIELAE